MADLHRTDVLVIGAGVLGVTIAFWLSNLYDCDVTLVESDVGPALHTSLRNTGVIHRPFYLDPQKKRIFARTSQISLRLWRALAEAGSLPWKPTGTFNVALDEEETRTLERYARWGLENGMEEGELEFLDSGGVKKKEPEIMCGAALVSKTDVSVDFGSFTRSLWRSLVARGVKFLGGRTVVSAEHGPGGTEVELGGVARSRMDCKLLINAAGGGALAIAHSMGFGLSYAQLNFRGEYWVVDEPFASRVTSNVYRPPRFPRYPFLDPHFVVRADGSRQIGPNAVVVPGPYVYGGAGLSKLPGYLGAPIGPKLKLFGNRDFVSLVLGEWASSLSQRVMCGRVKEFVPSLQTAMLSRRAVFGVRSSVIDGGGFVPEAVLLKGEGSAHVVNFNSPGATGAPAYSALVVDELRREGFMQGLRAKREVNRIPGWDFASVTGSL